MDIDKLILLLHGLHRDKCFSPLMDIDKLIRAGKALQKRSGFSPLMDIDKLIQNIIDSGNRIVLAL